MSFDLEMSLFKNVFQILVFIKKCVSIKNSSEEIIYIYLN